MFKFNCEHSDYEWIDTDHSWSKSRNGNYTHTKLLFACSLLKEEQYKTLKTSENFTWEKISKLVEKETGFDLETIMMIFYGASTGALNTHVDIIDYNRDGSWYAGVSHGNRWEENINDAYAVEISTPRGRKRLIKEIFKEVKEDLKTVTAKTIHWNLRKQDARFRQNQDGSGKKTSGVMMSSGDVSLKYPKVGRKLNESVGGNHFQKLSTRYGYKPKS